MVVFTPSAGRLLPLPSFCPILAATAVGPAKFLLQQVRMSMAFGEMYPERSFPSDGVANPAVVPLFEEQPGVDTPIDHDVWAAAEPPRRIAGSPARPVPARRRASAGDRQPPQEPKIDLVLYTSAESEKSQRAVRAVHDVLRGYEPSQVRLTTCDLSQRPQDGDVDAVVFTPTLVKQGPGPKTSIIGNLERPEILCDLLDASGVDRRWDD